MNLLKGAATTQLNHDNPHPLARYEPRPSPWAVSGWKMFLDCETDIQRAIEYVEMNPVRAGLRPQRWSFVTAWQKPAPAGLR